MENLKIRVNNYSEIKEAEKILLELGFSRVATAYSERQSGMVFSDGHVETHLHKLITLDQLRQMVNPMKEYSEIKEYLDPNDNYSYHKVPVIAQGSGWIEVPEGANFYSEGGFFKDESIWWSSHHEKWVNHDDRNLKFIIGEILWTRHTLPEELPFIDDEPKSAWDKQEGGNHYKKLKIQPMEYALANKLDYAQANVVKYVTRHADKNGKEDLLKAIHNIELMIEFYYGKTE